VDTHDRRSQETARRLGQHFLKSPKLAASLVTQAEIKASDLVIEFGAGKGILTYRLAAVGCRVLAVELDPVLATKLVRLFVQNEGVLIAAGDFFDLPLPHHPFRVFGSIPFGETTRAFRHLLEPDNHMMWRADLIVQRGAAIKRARGPHGNLLNVSWAPWWEFRMGRRIEARRFDPPPSSDAAMLHITRREEPLLPDSEWPSFARFTRVGFETSEIRAACGSLSAARFKNVSRQLGIPPTTRPSDLHVRQWLALYKASRPVEQNRVPRTHSTQKR
jgi:23S rRNA (adenine-N6)-dimethyltransferase